MRKYINKVFGLATSATAKDTYILFIGNLLSAFLGFVTTFFVARAFSVSDFGVYSAATNLIVIIASITDLGISSGLVSFASAAFNKGDTELAYKYSKAAFLIKIFATIPLVLACFIFADFIAYKWMDTNDYQISYWVGIISLAATFWGFLPYILQSKKLFLKSVIIDVSLSLPKAFIPYLLMIAGFLTLKTSLYAFAASAVIAGIVGFICTGIKFLKVRVEKDTYLSLIKFSSWIGVNRIISSISGKLDVQMLAAMAGATVTGLYSIPIRLASFIVVLASSYSAVLAPRFSSFATKEEEKKYLLKSSIVLIPLIAGLVFWILIAYPFITILFGDKFSQSVPIFKALVLSMIPYILAVPPVAAIIYSMKKTVYIGAFSFFQLIAIFIINILLIPKIGAYGPTVAFGFVNTILAVYTWVIVIKYYSSK